MLKVAWAPIYKHPLPENHRFPMEKYELLPEQLMYEGTLTQENFFEPKQVSEELILQAHNAEYWYKLKNLQLTRKEERATGFPLSHQLIEREIIIAGGSIQATEYALKHQVAMNIAGGTHHAFSNRGEGFCLLNDIALASYHLLNTQADDYKILVVDLDVHQGNGTAEIFKNNDRVFTFSMHGEKNYPLKKEKSDLDIPLPDGTGDEEYLKSLKINLKNIIESFLPKFVFFQSGVDVLADDKLGRLALSIEGCKERDRIVFELCKLHSLPLMVSMGGGYSKSLNRIIEAHANTYRLAQQILID
ncbi:MAG: histone deacetylase [Cyclobacteriaceae bacterium]|nr:histone deacetylase [Cyclobacteriaceae bacterium]MCH8516468.1 histone deacetylase [Cyclobacteriaceae bacterium]